MGRKNRNKNKKKQESDGSTGNINGGSNSSNSNSNNNHNNNISISTVDETVVATTTMVLSKQDLEDLDNQCKFKGYPKSKDFVYGFDHLNAYQTDLAIDSFKRGAHDGCVPCMFYYAELQKTAGNFHLALPLSLEGAIRGHVPCMTILGNCYKQSKPAIPSTLVMHWAKTKIEFGDTHITEEERKEIKKIDTIDCFVCGKKETKENNVTLVKCGICKYYSYCGKDCQTRHWQEGEHMHECRQVILLRKYCKPHYVKEIKEAILDGQDPKEIHTLQRLRKKLGLSRPKEEYEELVSHLDGSNNNNFIKLGTQVKVKGLVKASRHNGKIGAVTSSNVGTSSIPGEEHRRVGVNLSDDNGSFVIVAIKLKNLELASKYKFLVGRKDGTVHIGSTPNVI